MAKKDAKIIGGIFLLFSGFYVFTLTGDLSRVFGLMIAAVGLYFISSAFD